MIENLVRQDELTWEDPRAGLADIYVGECTDHYGDESIYPLDGKHDDKTRKPLKHT